MGYRDPKNFIDRELSWLAFNKRVLEEALDPKTPLLERIKFCGIVANNLDEFFMIRVSGVQEQIRSEIRRKTMAGLTPAMQFALIHQEAHRQIDALYECWTKELTPALERQRVCIVQPGKLARRVRRELRERFDRDVYPVLTPLAVDSGHPFPRLKGLSLNIIVHLRRSRRTGQRGDTLIAIVQVPGVLPRLLEVSGHRDKTEYVLLEDMIIEHMDLLFPGMKVIEAVPFRLSRDADIEYKEIDAEDLLKYIETEIRERERGTAVRLEIADRAGDLLTNFLTAMLQLGQQEIYRVSGPIAVNEIANALKIEGREALKNEPFTPNVRQVLRGPGSIFSKIRKQDILLHHPYESFVPVVDFIGAAAKDPKVLAIKQTLYRTSGDSPITKSLIEAAENGKQVTALVELKARFDEENNIVWARQLEEAGVHVVYGLVGLKTHAKCALVVRAEGNGIRRYIHLGTGNYNPTTARIYTDIGLFTCDPGFCNDASALFNMLTGYAEVPKWERMTVAPDHLRPKLIELINTEREKAERGRPARIRAKMNALVDIEIIVELYRASRAGVPIDLCIRGVCCLRPGVKGLSENIRVWSIVDRFLEHSRIFIFGEDPNPQVFLSSADWMDRNMDRRIETMFPIMDRQLADRCVNEIFAAAQRDNTKARYLQPDGRYKLIRPKANEPAWRCQSDLLKLEVKLRAEEKYDVNTSAEPEAEQAAKVAKPSGAGKGRQRAAQKRKDAQAAGEAVSEIMAQPREDGDAAEQGEPVGVAADKNGKPAKQPGAEQEARRTA